MDGPFRVRGFSLVELTVVMVLLAIMTALIVPEMRGTLEGERLRGASRQLMDALRLAYSQAVTAHVPHRLRWDAGSGRYQVERRGGENDPGQAYIPLDGFPACAGTIDSRVQINILPTTQVAAFDLDQNAPVVWPDNASDEASPDVIVFHPDGTADAREIVLRDGDGFGRALRIHPITAQIQLVKLDRTSGRLP